MSAHVASRRSALSEVATGDTKERQLCGVWVRFRTIVDTPRETVACLVPQQRERKHLAK